MPSIKELQEKVDAAKDAISALKKRKRDDGEQCRAAKLHCPCAKRIYDEHVAAAEQGDEEAHTKREFNVLFDLLKLHFEDPDISRWTCCNSGISANTEVFKHVDFRGACGIEGDTWSLTFPATYLGYVQGLAVKGGFSEEGMAFDPDDSGFEKAASNIDGRIWQHYERCFDKVATCVAELHHEGTISTSAFTFALDDHGRVCDLFLH